MMIYDRNILKLKESGGLSNGHKLILEAYERWLKTGIMSITLMIK